MTNIHPLRLAVGSHEAGSGQGCAMNVVSWESGDTTITDMPACADRVLARIVQRVNDSICAHRDGDLLCPACSVLVLDLAHRTVGTGTVALTHTERHRVWVRIAADQARQVAHLNPDPRVMAAIKAAEGWCDGTVTAEQCRRAHVAANAAACAANATYAAACAAAAYASVSVNAANAAADAANAYAANAAVAAYANAADAAADRLKLAHRAIDVFEQHTGFKAGTPDPVVVTRAVEQMAQVTA